MKPNVIDITKESLKLLNLKDYPALLATVCVIGGIYLLAMVWARRKDKKDVLKVSIVFAYCHPSPLLRDFARGHS